jgi:signal transduction histidine kinase
VTLRQSPDRVRLRVEDDGEGPDGKPGPNGDALSLGILGMQERLQPWGGHLSLEGGATGGTMVSAEVPLGSSHGRGS